MSIKDILENGTYRQGVWYWQYDEIHLTGISGEKVTRAIQRLREGHSYLTALPEYDMTREDAAYLLVNADRIIFLMENSEVT